MTDTLQSGAESALDLDKLEALAVKADGGEAWIYESKFHDTFNPSTVLDLIAMARRATAPHAEPAPAATTIGEVFRSVGGWMNGGELGYPSFGSMEALQKYTIKSIRAYLAAHPAVPAVGSALVAKAVPVAHYSTCERVPFSEHYSNKNHSAQFKCPVCGATRRQNLNFLGRSVLVCDGSKFKVEKKA